jgi:hypothetical protein
VPPLYERGGQFKWIYQLRVHTTEKKREEFNQQLIKMEFKEGLIVSLPS